MRNGACATLACGSGNYTCPYRGELFLEGKLVFAQYKRNGDSNPFLDVICIYMFLNLNSGQTIMICL